MALTRNSLKTALQDLAKASPWLHRWILTLYRRRRFRLNRKRMNGKGNQLLNTGILNGVRLDVVGDHNRIEIAPEAVLDTVKILVRGSHNLIRIGAGCHIAGSELWIEDQQCAIEIGAKTTFGGVHCAATETGSKIVIGEDCMLAYGIDIRTGDSHGIYDSTGVRINPAQTVIIGDHVWIATRAILLKGVVMGNGAIVATGAVVTKGNYPDHCLVAGNPARIVRENIQWSRSRSNSLMSVNEMTPIRKPA